MNEVWALREKRSSTSLVASMASNVQQTAIATSPLSSSYPFELPERRSTLRALIDEFRRGEHQLHRGPGEDVSSWAAPVPARGQLLKAPQSTHCRTPEQPAMKKSASVWYAAPPAPDRPLVTRMSMPNLRSGSTSDRRQSSHQFSGPIHEWHVYLQLLQRRPRKGGWTLFFKSKPNLTLPDTTTLPRDFVLVRREACYLLSPFFGLHHFVYSHTLILNTYIETKRYFWN